MLMQGIMDLSAEEASFIVKHYFHSSSLKTVQERFHVKFGDEWWLQNTTIERVVDCFRNKHILVR